MGESMLFNKKQHNIKLYNTKKILVVSILITLLIHTTFLGTVFGDDTLPDLTVKSVTIEGNHVEGEIITVKATIRNLNKKPATETFYVELFHESDEDNPVDIISVPGGLGGEKEVVVLLKWTAVKGIHNFTVFVNRLRDVIESNIDNNVLIFMLNISKRDTDLTFVESRPVIQGEVRIGLAMTITATTTNIGKNTTQDIPIVLYVNNNKIEQKTIKGLFEGEKKPVSFQYIPDSFGVFRIDLKIDPENNIKEYTTTNNNISKSITVDATSLEWYNPNWHYRIIYDVSDGGYVSIPVNFTKMLQDLGVYNKTFDNSTILIINHTSSTNISQIQSLNFNENSGYDAVTNATGNLIWGINKSGFYAVYFDVIENEDNRILSNTDDLNYSTSDNWQSKAIDAWWMRLNQTLKNYYYPDLEEMHINISSMANAKNINATYYYNASFESSVSLNTLTNTTWTTTRTFVDIGEWTVVISGYDNASYHPANLTYDFVVAKPDLTVLNITFKSDQTGTGPFYQGYNVNIQAQAFVFNTTVHNVNISMSVDGEKKETKTIDTLYKETNTIVEFKHRFETEGTYNITVTIDPDNTIKESNENNNTYSKHITIIGVPDLGVKTIIIPKTSYNEGERVIVYAHITNSGNLNATNYQVNLYLEDNKENEMRFVGKKNHTFVSVDKNQTKNITLAWDSSKPGNWIVGVKILTNATNPDSNILNNSKAVFTPRITVKGDDPPPDTDPVIELISPIPLQEFERNYPLLFSAKITDQVGIKQANLSITTPNGTLYTVEMLKGQNNIYTYNFQKTYHLGLYNFTITALDSSIFQNTANVTGNFTIIEDATPPTIEFMDVTPKVQLPNKEVTISSIVSDPSGVAYVNVSIIYPDGGEKTYQMSKPTASERYTFTQTYEQFGKYTAYIIAQDTLGNRKSAEDKAIEFWITSNLEDTDNDKIPDWWEIKYGLDPYDPSDALEDRSGDGYTNLRKYELGLNPNEKVTLSQRIRIQTQEHIVYLVASLALLILLISIYLYALWRKKL
jgi:hypothetical protein